MSNNELPKKILMVDDDSTVIEALDAQLQRHGITLVKATNMDTALYLFNQQRFEAAIIELEFEPVSGLTLVQKFRQSDTPERRNIGILITAGREKKATDEALLGELGNLEFVDKPINAIKLLPALMRVVQRKRFAEKYEETSVQARSIYNTTGDINKAMQYVSANLEGNEKAKLELMCEMLEEAKKYDDALRIHQSCLKQNPNDLKHLNAVGRLLLKGGRTQEAREYLVKVDEAAPGNIARLEAMAQMFVDLKDPSAAVEKMKNLISLSPEKKELRFELFDKLDNSGFHDDAIGMVKDTTSPNEVVRHYNNKGVILSKEGKRDHALKDYYSALMFFPKFKENYRILFNIALAEAQKKTDEGFKAALDALAKCLTLEPGFKKAKDLKDKIEATWQGGKTKKAG